MERIDFQLVAKFNLIPVPGPNMVPQLNKYNNKKYQHQKPKIDMIFQV